MNSVGFCGHPFSAVVSDWNDDPFMADYFNFGIPTFNDATFPQSYFWPTPPSPSSTDGNLPTFFWETQSSTQTAEYDVLPLLSGTPGAPSIYPQSTTIPTDDIEIIGDTRYEKVTWEDAAPTGNMHFSVAGPTMPPLVLSVLLAATFPTNWIRIPQRYYECGSKQLDFKRSETIHFSTKDHPGINLRGALRKDFSSLSGRDDPMLLGASGVISCRLMFPGYPDNGSSCQIHTLNWKKTRIPIPRSKLVHEVARRVDQYLTRMAGTTPDGPVEERWRIGQGSMCIENMYLVSLTSVSKGSFQPEIWVAVPSVSRASAGEGRD